MGTRLSVEEEGRSPSGTPFASAWRKYRPESLDARTWPLVAWCLCIFSSWSAGTVSYSLPCTCPAPRVAKNISIPTTTSTEVMAMSPAMAVYPWFQNEGRQDSVRETKAVGRRCTNAVAMRTPVPKCRDRKRKW